METPVETMLELADKILASPHASKDSKRLAHLVKSMDARIRSGGEMPAPWRRKNGGKR